MNKEDYISSGILESYVLDQLSVEEKQEVETMALENLEIRQELEQIELGFQALAMKTSVKAPPGTKEEVFSKIESPTIPINSRNESNFFKYATAASVILAITMGAVAYFYWSKWQSAETQLSDLISQNLQITDNLNKASLDVASAKQTIQILQDPNFNQVKLNGTENAPNALASIFWNRDSQEVFLQIQQLQQLPDDRQYQLWAIIDGNPVDAGVFDLADASTLLAMKSASSVSAFAITIEPRGGSISPSLETMQVLGEV